MNFFEKVWFKALRTESESEKITNLSGGGELLIKSKAKSITFASAVKTEVPSGIRIDSL